ncbi:MAG: metallophosphoesterase family protein [Phycisphaeraceae bacterium]|nr:metallophosphoesterase family protein [Phycisphaeraceae bacterium]
MKRRTVILSDTHLAGNGQGAGSADALRPLWQGANELILNGDTAELSHPTLRASAAREVMRIQDLCEEDGVRLTFLSGNHDPLITDRRFLRLCGGEVFLTHGDMLHPSISPWTSYAKQLRELHEGALSQLELMDRAQLDQQAMAAAHASHIKWDHLAEHDQPKLGRLAKGVDQARKVAKVLWFWHRLPKLAAAFAARYAPESRFFIFGHIHRAGVWQFGHQTIINTGSYHCPRRPHAIVLNDQTLTMHRVHYDAESGHRLIEQPRFTATLEHTQTLAPDEQPVVKRGRTDAA